MWLIIWSIILVITFLYYINQLQIDENRTGDNQERTVVSETDQSEVAQSILHSIIVRICNIDILCEVKVYDNTLVRDLIIDICKTAKLSEPPGHYYLTLDAHELDINDTIQKSGLLNPINTSISEFPELRKQEEENDDDEKDKFEESFLVKQWSPNRCAERGVQRKFTTIYIGNFGDQLDKEKLSQLLSQYGKIMECKIETDENGRSKGFGFCTYENSNGAKAAVKNLDGYTIEDESLYVGGLLKKDERTNKYESVNLYIKNLGSTVDDERLRKEFSKFGTITSAKVMSENGRSKGFGFVCFSAPDEATKAIAEMNGSIIDSKQIYVGLAQRKEERRMYLANQHMQLPFHKGMGCVMPSLRTASPTYRPTPRWAGASATGLRPLMLAGMQIPSNMSGLQARTSLPIDARPTTSDREPLTPTNLANATSQERKQILSERLLPLIQQMQPELTGTDKITDMLLEIDHTELLRMIESYESFKTKIEKATAVLQLDQNEQTSTVQ